MTTFVITRFYKLKMMILTVPQAFEKLRYIFEVQDVVHCLDISSNCCIIFKNLIAEIA